MSPNTDTIRDIESRIASDSVCESDPKWKQIVGGSAVVAMPLCVVVYFAFATQPSDVLREVQTIKLEIRDMQSEQKELLHGKTRTQPADVLGEVKLLRQEVRSRTDDRFHAAEFREFVDQLKTLNPELKVPE